MKNINYTEQLLKVMKNGNIEYRNVIISRKGEAWQVAGHTFTKLTDAYNYIDSAWFHLEKSIKLN